MLLVDGLSDKVEGTVVVSLSHEDHYCRAFSGVSLISLTSDAGRPCIGLAFPMEQFLTYGVIAIASGGRKAARCLVDRHGKEISVRRRDPSHSLAPLGQLEICTFSHSREYLKARVLARGTQLSLLVNDGAKKVQIDLPPEVVPAALKRYVDRDVIAGIRAEAVSLASANVTRGPLQHPFDAMVEVVEPTGADTLVVLAIGDQEMTARLEPDLHLKHGQTASFLVDLSKLVCFDVQTESLIAD